MFIPILSDPAFTNAGPNFCCFLGGDSTSKISEVQYGNCSDDVAGFDHDRTVRRHRRLLKHELEDVEGLQGETHHRYVSAMNR